MQTKDNTQVQHTPGPWRVETIMGISRIVHGEVEPDTGFSDDVMFESLADPVARANASLIAAAPEMYEALSDAVDVLDWIHNKHSEVAGFATVDAVKNGRAALAAAKGTK